MTTLGVRVATSYAILRMPDFFSTLFGCPSDGNMPGNKSLRVQVQTKMSNKLAGWKYFKKYASTAFDGSATINKTTGGSGSKQNGLVNRPRDLNIEVRKFEVEIWTHFRTMAHNTIDWDQSASALQWLKWKYQQDGELENLKCLLKKPYAEISLLYTRVHSGWPYFIIKA